MTENENIEIVPQTEDELENIIAEVKQEQAAEETAASQPVAAPKRKKKLLGRIIYIALLAIFIAVFVYCAYYIANYAIGSQSTSNDFASLSDRVNAIKDQNANDDHSGATIPTGTGSGEETDTSGILPEYREVYAMNPCLLYTSPSPRD